jgi:hypothetical protein
VNGYNKHYSSLLGAPTSPFPLVQKFPEIGNMPVGQQRIMDNVARTLKTNVSSDGEVSFSLSPLADPTVEEATGTFLAQLPPAQRNSFLMAMLAVKSNQQEVRHIGEDANTGFLSIYTYDPQTGKTGIIPFAKTGRTPEEKAALDVSTAGKKKREETLAGERAKIEASLENIKTGKILPSGEPEVKPAYMVEAEQKAESQTMSAEGVAAGKRKSDTVPALQALSLLQNYSRQIHTANSPQSRVVNGLMNTVQGWADVGAAKSYKDYSGALLGEMSRIFGAERGVLTNQDIDRAKALIPGMFSTGEFAERRFKELRQFLTELEGRTPQTGAKSGEYQPDHIYYTPQGKPVVYLGKDAQGNDSWKQVKITGE